MYLDISHQPADFVRRYFPTIYRKLLTLGIDLTRQPVPIVPAAHYTCGGVVVDRHGRTDIGGLYAIGEISYSGLYGANRLASNSLLECLVYGWSAAENILRNLPSQAEPVPALPSETRQNANPRERQTQLNRLRSELQHIMWQQAGIVRSSEQLMQAQRDIHRLQQQIDDLYSESKLSVSLLEVRNLMLVAALMVRSALSRKESRELHYILDYPSAAPGEPQPTLLQPD